MIKVDERGNEILSELLNSYLKVNGIKGYNLVNEVLNTTGPIEEKVEADVEKTEEVYE